MGRPARRVNFPLMRAVFATLAVTLAAAAIGLGCFQPAGAEPLTKPGAKSGGSYHKPVCPKTPGPQVMRCHSLIVTDSKGNPIETPAPRPQLPNGKRPDR